MKSFNTYLFESNDELRTAVSSYIGYTGLLNQRLRETPDQIYPDHAKWISTLDKHMKPIQATNKKLHRGISHSSLDPTKLKEGDIIHDHGYMSTSTNGGVAGTFAAYKSDPIVRLHITAPAGTRAISVKQALRGYNAYNKGEDEHILARGTHLRIDKIHHFPSNGKSTPSYHIDTTVVHQDH
jgi:hypothetical protein